MTASTTAKVKPVNPARVWLEEKDCVRMTRNELTALQWILSALSVLADVDKNLSNRLSMIPDGRERIRQTVEELRDIADDVIGTMTREQAKRVKGVMTDYELRIMPKAMPAQTNIYITKDQGMTLVDCAKAECRTCVADDKECLKCKLYQILEAVVPLDDYDNGMLCPYNMLGWAD